MAETIREERLEAALRIGREMRQRQKELARDKSPIAVARAVDRERAFDNALVNLLGEVG